MFIAPPHMAQQQQQQINGQFDNKLKSSEFSNRNNIMQTSYGAPHGLNLQNSVMGQQQQPANSQQVSCVMNLLYYISDNKISGNIVSVRLIPFFTTVNSQFLMCYFFLHFR